MAAGELQCASLSLAGALTGCAVDRCCYVPCAMASTDFGVSSDIGITIGAHHTVTGTPHWMAPEVLMHEDYNEKADVRHKH